jgi:hypothetical protein
MRENFKRAHHKSLPILKFRIGNPDVPFDEIAKKFGRTRAAVYSLFHKHGLLDLPEPTRLIIEDPFDIGHEIPVIPQPTGATMKINMDQFKLQYPKDSYKEPVEPPTQGQQVLRDEVDRLHAEIANLTILDEVNDGLLADYASEIEQLKSDIVGYRAVISYLQGQINGASV